MRQFDVLRSNQGAITVLVAVASAVLLLSAALSFDIGRVIIAAQEAQKAADAASLGGATLLPNTAAASSRVSAVVIANSGVSTFSYTQVSGSPIYYGAGATPPGFRVLGPFERAVRVAVQTDVEHFFAPIAGLTQTHVERSALAARLAAGQIPAVPMWISADTPLVPGQSVELHMSTAGDSDNTGAIPPGNFGWLTPGSGGQDFSLLLGGYQVPPATLQENLIAVGDTVFGYPGQKVGRWYGELGTSHDDLGRLDRAAVPPYDTQTPSDFTADNPRILLVPLVTVISGSGGNASYLVVRFAMFWLESVNRADKSIIGQVIDGDVPGLPGSDTGIDSGVFTVKLVG
jgi:hypothetical protein